MTAARHDIRDRALHWLRVDDPVAKAGGVRADRQSMLDAPGGWALDAQREIAEPTDLPGRPALPHLVTATQVPARSPHTPAGRAALLHAIAHIEFNAIKKVFLVGIPRHGIPCFIESS